MKPRGVDTEKLVVFPKSKWKCVDRLFPLVISGFLC